LQLVADADSLADWVSGYLAEEPTRLAAGEKAAEVVERNRGATERLLELLSTEVQAATGGRPH
jgi:3-deoxy-D-manno-octulosonic-acid transferase